MTDPAQPAPKMPAVRPPADPNSITCPACGWPNRPGSIKCEFCTTPFQRAAPAAPPTFILCPHCGGESLKVTGRRKCPDCGRGYDEMPSPSRRALATAIRLVRSIRLSAHAFIFIAIVGLGLTAFFVQFCAQRKGQTAEHMRHIKKALEIHLGQWGGYPETLEDLGRSGFMPPDNELVDAWGKKIRYTPSRPLGRTDVGTRTYAEYEIRSAGSNEKFDDADDMIWVGKEDAGGPPMAPMGGDPSMPIPGARER